jgi:hypothetical protein
MKLIYLTLKKKLSIIWRLLKTNAISEDYTIKELIEDEW